MSKRCAPRQRQNAQFWRHTTFAIMPAALPREQRTPSGIPLIRVCPHAWEPASAGETWKSKDRVFVRDPLLVVHRDNSAPRAPALTSQAK